MTEGSPYENRHVAFAVDGGSRVDIFMVASVDGFVNGPDCKWFWVVIRLGLSGVLMGRIHARTREIRSPFEHLFGLCDESEVEET